VCAADAVHVSTLESEPVIVVVVVVAVVGIMSKIKEGHLSIFLSILFRCLDVSESQDREQHRPNVSAKGP
jgi:hypothetical protein